MPKKVGRKAVAVRKKVRRKQPEPGAETRLAASAPFEILQSVLADASGDDVKKQLIDDLTNRSTLKIRGGLRFELITASAPVAKIVQELMRAQPAASDVSINLFPRRLTRQIDEFRAAFLESCFLLITLMAAVKPVTEHDCSEIIRLAASATPAGRILRKLAGDTPPLEPQRRQLPRESDDIPGIPGLSKTLLIPPEELMHKGDVRELKGILFSWGRGLDEGAPKYLEDVVGDLAPPDNCPGERMEIRGQGFGSRNERAVVFVNKDRKGVLANVIHEWTEERVSLTIPNQAIRGPIGILSLPPAQMSLDDLKATVTAALRETFGRKILKRVGNSLEGLTGFPIRPPALQNNNKNLYTGGPPIIEYFNVSPQGFLWPGRKITLSWSVIGADRIGIVASDIPNRLGPNELPPIQGPLPAVGTREIRVPGTRTWHGQYLLKASNRCTVHAAPRLHGIEADIPVEKAISLEMLIRRGLALGGGGTRGDFQVGALLYLYDVRGYRPDGIASCSVGSINAIQLVMGDQGPAFGRPARSAASLLAEIWLDRLVDEASMWGIEPWLTDAKADISTVVGSISLAGLVFLPITLVTGLSALKDLQKLLENPREKGIVALFNLKPIEAIARAVYDQNRTNMSGIKCRLVSISVETGEFVLVNERGAVLQRGPQPHRPLDVPAAPATDFVDGVMASATMPGVFPARRLADHMCVDGGVREIVPVQVAINDLGCNEVIAIRVSARPPILETDPMRPFAGVIARSVFDLTYDAIADDDVSPFGGWGDGVKVTTIRPSFNLHDPMVVEPGLIRIGMDYGWMRAADELDVPAERRAQAKSLSDEITRLRAQNWHLTHQAAAVNFRDPHRGFANFVFSGIAVTAGPEIRSLPSPEAVDAIRKNCRAIRKALEYRLLIGAPTPPSAVRSTWFTEWELIHLPPNSPTPWAHFHGGERPGGELPAEMPPPPI